MGRDIVIAGENGELYHITEDELKASHKMPEHMAQSARIQGMAGSGKMSHYINQETGEGVQEEWAGGATQTVNSDHIHFLNLGVTHNKDES